MRGNDPYLSQRLQYALFFHKYEDAFSSQRAALALQEVILGKDLKLVKEINRNLAMNEFPLLDASEDPIVLPARAQRGSGSSRRYAFRKMDWARTKSRSVEKPFQKIYF